ncbi:MAG: B12-binding domain-containing radical SAM protein [Bacillota bacterium]
MRVLFIYPNVNKEKTIQIGISSLLGVIKQEGHEYRLLDFTFIDNDEAKEILLKILNEDHFDLVACSVRSTEWSFLRRILNIVPKEIPVIVGGPHPSVVPEEVMEEQRVDILCVGEGEIPLAELLRRMSSNRGYDDIPGLWVRLENGEIKRNPIGPLTQLDKLPFMDWSQFDDRHIVIDNMYGETRRVGAFELSRGCPFSCTYCINHTLQRITKGKGKYHREKSPERCIEEILFFKEKYNLEYIYFVDETFLINTERLKEFCSLYKEKINLPFCFMSRPELIDEEKIKIIAKAGGHAAGIGIETGSETLRKSLLNRHMTNSQIENAFKLVKSYGLITSSFNMVGLPNETDEDIQLTIDINRIVKPDVVQVTIFYPLPGTDLMDYCIENDLIDTETYHSLINYYDFSVLKFPQAKKEKIYRLTRLIPMLVWAKDEYLPLFTWILDNHDAYVNILNRKVNSTFFSELFMVPSKWNDSLYATLFYYAWDYIHEQFKLKNTEEMSREKEDLKNNFPLENDLSKVHNNLLSDGSRCSHGQCQQNKSIIGTIVFKISLPIKNYIKKIIKQ